MMLVAVSWASMARLTVAGIADGDQARLEEGQRSALLAVGVIVLRNEPLLAVGLDGAAVLDGQIFKSRGIEIAARDQERAVGAWGDGRDDVLDVALDVDARFLLELFLPLLLHRHHFLDAQAELRIHDRADVGVGDDGRVRWDIPQLDRPGGGGKRLKSAAVVGDEPCAQPGCQHSG